MGNIQIKNQSTIADYAALMRISRFLAGDEYYAFYNEGGNKVIEIIKENNWYIVNDINNR